jgi:hypothetical protein
MLRRLRPLATTATTWPIARWRTVGIARVPAKLFLERFDGGGKRSLIRSQLRVRSLQLRILGFEYDDLGPKTVSSARRIETHIDVGSDFDLEGDHVRKKRALNSYVETNALAWKRARSLQTNRRVPI